MNAAEEGTKVEGQGPKFVSSVCFCEILTGRNGENGAEYRASQMRRTTNVRRAAFTPTTDQWSPAFDTFRDQVTVRLNSKSSGSMVPSDAGSGKNVRWSGSRNAVAGQSGLGWPEDADAPGVRRQSQRISGDAALGWDKSLLAVEFQAVDANEVSRPPQSKTSRNFEPRFSIPAAVLFVLV